MVGMIYLVQPCELLGTKRFKIGMSGKNTLDRINKGYRKGTRYLNIQEVEDPRGLENRIKKIFDRKFTLIAGREYYEGNEYSVRTTFANLVNGDYKMRHGICYYFMSLAQFALLGFIIVTPIYYAVVNHCAMKP